MGMICAVMGESGSGKTSSLRNFKKGEVFVFEVAGKELPFRNDWSGYIMRNAGYDKIKSVLLKAASNEKNTIKSFVIDDSQYLMAFESFAHANETGYGKFTNMGKNFYLLLKFIKESLPRDFIVYLLHHTEMDASGKYRIKTLGKMLDNQLVIEGLLEEVLMTNVSEGKYSFITHNLDGMSTVKTPMGMFKEDKIDNDLKMVDTTMRKYWNLGKEEE